MKIKIKINKNKQNKNKEKQDEDRTNLIINHTHTHSYILKGHNFSKRFFEVSLLVIDYKHLIINYKIQNSKFKTLLKAYLQTCLLVIDYTAR